MTFEQIIFQQINPRTIEKKQYLPLMKEIYDFAVTARREGLLAIEDRLQELFYPLLKTALQLIVDGTDGKEVTDIVQRIILVSNETPDKIYEGCIILAGALAIQEGDNPRIVRDKMQSFLGNIELPEYDHPEPEKKIDFNHEYEPNKTSEKFCALIDLCDNRVIQKLIREVSIHRIARALWNVTLGTRNAFQQNMTIRVEARLQDELKTDRFLDLERSVVAQKETMNYIKKLGSLGGISIGSRKGKKKK